MTTKESQVGTELEQGPPLTLLFGRAEKMKQVRDKLQAVAQTQIPVLLQGESGTGKELYVKLLHAWGNHTPQSLIKVNCPAIPHALLEAELFGYEKGAFTGAHTTKKGRIEHAHNGTLFLDEVGGLDLAIQSKMLQVLQDGTLSRIGGHEIRSVKVRMVSVNNRDLQEQVHEGSFRLDLLYRLNAVTIDIPPLRERPEDIAALVDYFMIRYAREFRTNPQPLSRGLLRELTRYHWPGNVRQLENVLRSYALIGEEENVWSELVAGANASPGLLPEIDLSKPISLKMLTKQATQDLERHVILKVLKANGWNRQKTAKWLKISYRSLLYKLNEVGPEMTGFRRSPAPKPLAPKTAAPAKTSLGPRLL